MIYIYIYIIGQIHERDIYIYNGKLDLQKFRVYYKFDLSNICDTIIKLKNENYFPKLISKS